MELVTGAVGSLIPKLMQLGQEEYKLQKGVREQIESLSRELQVMHAALAKVAEAPPDQLDAQVKLWARDVREVSYAMEDIVDDFLVRVDDGRRGAKADKLRELMEKMGGLFSLGKAKARREIAGAIRDVKKRLQEVVDRHGRYTAASVVAKSTTAAASTIDSRIMALYEKASNLVGIDGPRDQLMEMLSLGDEQTKVLKIVSIVGFAGLGKTTLAKAVFDKLFTAALARRRSQSGFDCWAFVPVGQNPDMKKVFRDILIDLDNQNHTASSMMMLDERQLIDKLREFLQGKRYFIVMDDIWDEKLWKLIRCALVDYSCGSKIVVTTRIFQVATYAGYVFKLEPLSHDNSKKLFLARIADKEGICPEIQSTEIYDKILRKCSGVPLAIITIASLLGSESMEHWYKVYNSIGFGHGDRDVVENTRKILLFSYNNLPCHLRTCLLYLSVYPEDYLIKKYTLIWKWIAEGFIHDEQGKGLLEVGEGYFNELINRSMIQPVELYGTGYVRGCRVHDLVVDLIRSLSSGENFVSLCGNEHQTLPCSIARRLASHNGIKENNVDANIGMQHVRSFTSINCNDYTTASTSFRVLRVLAIEHCKFMEGYDNLNILGNLLHLRYLGLQYTPIRELPKEIGRLKFLQSMNLYGTGIEQLPSSIGLLTQLLSLVADLKTRVPDWIGNMTSLQLLQMYSTADKSERFVNDLGRLREMRILVTSIDLTDERMESCLMESLGNLHMIRCVRIKGEPLIHWGATWEKIFASQQLVNLSLGCLVFCRLPGWINCSDVPNLAFLELRLKVVLEQDMETLGRMPRLSGLLIGSIYTSSVSIAGGHGYFKKLRCFTATFALERRHGECKEATLMPRLELLDFTIDVRYKKDSSFGFGNLALENLPSLRKAMVDINCKDAFPVEVEEAEAALRHAVAMHPNRPTLETRRLREDGMLSSNQSQPRYINHSVGQGVVTVRVQKDRQDYLDFRGFKNLFNFNPCLQRVDYYFDCNNATVEEVVEAETALRYAIDMHPNRGKRRQC